MIKIWYVLAGMILACSASAEIVFVKQDSLPKYFPQTDGRLGLCDDLYLRLYERLKKQTINIRIDPELYPIKRILRLLEAGKVHVFCGAERNKKREAMYNYSALPVYHVSNVVMSHVSEPFVPEALADLARDYSPVGAL